MATVGIELSDVGVHAVAFESDGSTRALMVGGDTERLPAYAFSPGPGKDLIFGIEAQELGHVYPRRVNSSFIDDLSLKATPFAGSRSRTAYSQIAYEFLAKVFSRVNEECESVEKVVLAVPGHFLEESEVAEQRMGILLGILGDLKVPLAGVVDLAAASLYSEGLWGVAEGERLFHLDILLHATHVTVFSKRHGLDRLFAARQSQCGFHMMQERFSTALANRFLKQTSFDITEDSRIEQAFHAQTRDLLFHLGRSGEARLEVSSKEKSREMKVTRDVATVDLAPIVKMLTQLLLRTVNDFGPSDEPVQIVLSERASAIQGLKESIRAQGVGTVKELPSESAAFGAANLGKTWELPSSIETVRVQTGIDLATPQRGEDAKETESEPSPVGAIRIVKQGKSLNPTHIVCDGLAYELGEREFIVGFGESEAFDLVVERDLTPAPIELCRLRFEGDRWELAESHRTVVESGSIASLRAGDSLEVAIPGRRKQLLLIHCI